MTAETAAEPVPKATEVTSISGRVIICRRDKWLRDKMVEKYAQDCSMTRQTRQEVGGDDRLNF